MTRADIGKLGRSIAGWVAARGGVRDQWGEVTIETAAGLFNVHFDEESGCIYGKFRDPTAAHAIDGNVNRFSGKFNHHFSAGTTAAEAFDEFTSAMGRFLAGFKTESP
jgi:hypothetical protein